MAKIKDIIAELEKWAPPSLQESYDNSRLITGNQQATLSGILISLDCIEAVVEEAIDHNCNMIVAHHPIVFSGLKSLTGNNYIERTIIKAIKHDIAIYAIHTNLDNVQTGVNSMIARKLDLQNTRILAPKKNTLMKLSCFVPKAATDKLLTALSEAGAGNIGNYDACSFVSEGTGTFRPNEVANPTLGKQGEISKVEENRIEVIFESHKKLAVLQAMRTSHPYEEAAYYLHSLENEQSEVGSGMIGDLPTAMTEQEFLAYLKEKMALECVRYTRFTEQKISKVALCGGAGSFLLPAAIRAGAQALVTADFKYHQFFDAENRLMIADIGHYESEAFTKELIYEHMMKKFTNIALHLSNTRTNPVNYYI